MQVELQYDERKRRRNDSVSSNQGSYQGGTHGAATKHPMFHGTQGKNSKGYNNAMEMVPTAGSLFQVNTKL